MRPPLRERIRLWACRHFGHRPYDDPYGNWWCQRCKHALDLEVQP